LKGRRWRRRVIGRGRWRVIVRWRRRRREGGREGKRECREREGGNRRSRGTAVNWARIAVVLSANRRRGISGYWVRNRRRNSHGWRILTAALDGREEGREEGRVRGGNWPLFEMINGTKKHHGLWVKKWNIRNSCVVLFHSLFGG
jgi:hypothetical protein